MFDKAMAVTLQSGICCPRFFFFFLNYYRRRQNSIPLSLIPSELVFEDGGVRQGDDRHYFAPTLRLLGCLPLELVASCTGEITWALRFRGAFDIRVEGAEAVVSTS